MAVWLALHPAPPLDRRPAGDDEKMVDLPDGTTLAELRQQQMMLWQRELPGEKPDEPAEISITHEVDTSRGKDRMYLYLTEKHGYYVETIDVDIWYTGGKDITEPNDSPLHPVFLPINNFIPAKGTLKTCLEFNPAELDKVGGNVGTSEDWAVRVKRYNRARLQNPDPLPSVADSTCD